MLSATSNVVPAPMFRLPVPSGPEVKETNPSPALTGDGGVLLAPSTSPPEATFTPPLKLLAVPLNCSNPSPVLLSDAVPP